MCLVYFSATWLCTRDSSFGGNKITGGPEVGWNSSHKSWPDKKTKHTTGKSKPKLVSGPIVRFINQSIAKRHQFGNCSFYKILYCWQVEWARLARSPYRTLLRLKFPKWRHFAILWWMALKIGPLTNFGLLFSLACFMLCFDQTIVELLYCGKVYYRESKGTCG